MSVTFPPAFAAAIASIEAMSSTRYCGNANGICSPSSVFMMRTVLPPSFCRVIASKGRQGMPVPHVGGRGWLTRQ